MKFRVNRQLVETQAAAEMPLLWFLRDELELCGTKFGCGAGLCGACTVHLDGQAVRSCQTPIQAAAERDITTIEGLATRVTKDAEQGQRTMLHPLQQAWVDADVPQCGYCQAGQIMQAAALLAINPRPTRNQIIEAMSGNLCRCGTYPRIIAAIETVVQQGSAPSRVIGQAQQPAPSERSKP